MHLFVIKHWTGVFVTREECFFWENLLEECNKALYNFDPACDGIQRRQLFNDIRFMESEEGWSIPLKRIRFGRRVYYRY